VSGAPALGRTADAGAAGTTKLRARKNGPDVKSLMVYLAPDLAKRLKLHCAAHDVTASGLVAELIAKHLDAQGGR
jgi:hypothetical protein